MNYHKVFNFHHSYSLSSFKDIINRNPVEAFLKKKLNKVILKLVWKNEYLKMVEKSLNKQ